MHFMLHWAALILVVTAILLSLFIWRRQRDRRVLLLTAMLAGIGANSALSIASIVGDFDVGRGYLWAQLTMAALGVAAVVGLDRLLRAERQRRQAISRVQWALEESEHRYRVLFEESLDARYISNVDGSMIDINGAGVELYGYGSREELLERFSAPEHYVDADAREKLFATLRREGHIRNYPVEVRRVDGAIVQVLESAVVECDAKGAIVALRGSLHDVTEQRELQRQLLHSQRMEAVGRMAGGVAHDFNNMLTVINGRSDLLLDQLDEDSAAASDVREIKDAAQRAAAFTRGLLLLSRREVLAPESMDLNAVVTDLSLLLQRAVGDDVSIELDLETEIGCVLAGATEMEQVLLNLVINARDAMPAGGRLQIATRLLQLAPAQAEARGVTPGSWVELSVEDEGLGIQPETIDHIFEPFFTTKDPTIGTGLGLSTVFGIVKQLKGDIAVESEPDQGTRFSILIPSDQESEAEAMPSLPAPDPMPRGSETLLVVDDEPSVRRFLRQYLEKQGYRVLVAEDGERALEWLEGDEQVNLLISDVMMPGLRGDELAERALELRSALPVLLISGHADQSIPPETTSCAFLSKPFTTRELGQQIRELLDA